MDEKQLAALTEAMPKAFGWLLALETSVAALIDEQPDLKRFATKLEIHRERAKAQLLGESKNDGNIDQFDQTMDRIEAFTRACLKSRGLQV